MSAEQQAAEAISFQQQAAEMIWKVDEDERDESDYPWIMFLIDETPYAINSKYVLSIEILEEITPIVNSPHYCPGFAESRGEFIELIDTRALFGLGDYISAKAGKIDARYMMLVTEIDEVKRGLIVDDIISVEFISRFTKDVLGDENGCIRSQYVRQIAIRDKTENPILIINPDSFGLLSA